MNEQTWHLEVRRPSRLSRSELHEGGALLPEHDELIQPRVCEWTKLAGEQGPEGGAVHWRVFYELLEERAGCGQVDGLLCGQIGEHVLLQGAP